MGTYGRQKIGEAERDGSPPQRKPTPLLRRSLRRRRHGLQRKRSCTGSLRQNIALHKAVLKKLNAQKKPVAETWETVRKRILDPELK